MKRIFISYATPDKELARQLEQDLRQIGHDVGIDLNDLSVGDDAIEWMSSEIKRANKIVVLHSKHSAEARWQKIEISAAIWNEVEQNGGTVIVVRLDESDLSPVLGRKSYTYTSPGPELYQDLLAKLSEDLIPTSTPTTVVDRAFQESSVNPFWRLRAEYYEDIPAVLASTFSKPENEKWGNFQNLRPCIVEGSRGTGKTMLLMSLRARTLASASSEGSKKVTELFGFYLRLTKGAFANAGIEFTRANTTERRGTKAQSQVIETFTQQLYLGLVESLVSEISYCTQHKILDIPERVIEDLSNDLLELIGCSPLTTRPLSFDPLLIRLDNIHRAISEFVRRRFIYDQKNVQIPIARLDLDCFKSVVRLIKRHVPALLNAQMTILLDEYENLSDIQRQVVNDLVKFAAPMSVKIAKKIGIEDTAATTTGQPLQETHDYHRINLVYHIENDVELQNYLRLLSVITSKALEQQKLHFANVDALLPPAPSPQFDATEIESEIAKMLGRDQWKNLGERERMEKAKYYKESAVFRLVYNRPGGGRTRLYSGFHDLGFISSGVIRYFQEIIGTAFHLQYSDSFPKEGASISLSPENQSKAIYLVSEHNLTSLSRNVESYGEQLKYFLLDLGDCLRHKLLHHSSEPEAGRIALIDPEQLTHERHPDVYKLLMIGIREGVFQTKEGRPGMRPKHRGDPQPEEFNISRVFAPVLQFSPRLRWKSDFRAEDFQALLNPMKRRDALRRIFARLGSHANTKQPDLPLE